MNVSREAVDIALGDWRSLMHPDAKKLTPGRVSKHRAGRAPALGPGRKARHDRDLKRAEQDRKSGWLDRQHLGQLLGPEPGE